jgi:cytochrome c oxidase subunit 1
MAIEIQPERAEPGGRDPEIVGTRHPWWRRPGVPAGVIGAAAGYFLGHWLGNFLGGGYARSSLADTNDVAIVLGYAVAVIGWLVGLGVFNDLFQMMLGKPLREESRLVRVQEPGLGKYFRYTLDHKVVGIQYLYGMIVYFLTGGLFAMAIRSELLSPTYHLIGPQQYLMVVGEHGTMMMMMMSSVILGPFGQYFGPLLIGSKRVAFPRLEALGFWLTVPAYVILLSAVLMGGFSTGWTGYEPLATQATQGEDAYFFAFGLMGISMILAGFNMIVTVINYRAPGMRWSRLPMFVWSMFTVSFLQVLAVPVLIGACYMALEDRTFQTAFFTNQLGGSSFLYEDLFWFFGHPEVYILALPGFGLISEIISVFCRKPLFGYKVSVAGMVGVGLASFLVWQHHLFDSGINPDMRPLFMLTTEIISIPTGFIFLVAMGTFWKARIRFHPHAVRAGLLLQLPVRRHQRRVLVGRSRGHDRARLLLRDGALPLHDHGRPDLRVLCRHLLLAAEDDRDQAERDARQDPLLDHVHLLQHDLPAVVRARHAGHAAQSVRIRTQPGDAQRLGLYLVVLPGRLDTHLRDQLRHVDDVLADARGWQPLAGSEPGVAASHAGATGQLHASTGDPRRLLRLWRA